MVSLEFHGVGTVAFNNGTWNRTAPPMLVFDQEFVRQNVHAAEEVTRDNKRSLFRVIIGSSGVSLAREIESLDDENRRLNGTIRDLEAAIKAVVPAVTDIAAFEATSVPTDLPDRIEDASRNLKLAQEASELQRRPSVATCGLDDDIVDCSDLLGKTLGVGLEQSRGRVAAHVTKHGLDEKAGRWFQYGVEHSHNADCPFCDQPLVKSEVYGALQLLFGTEYKALATDIEVARDALRPLVQPGASNLTRVIGQNRALADYWRSVIALPHIPSLSDNEIAQIAMALNAMFHALECKLGDLSTIVAGPSGEEWKTAVAALGAYDAAVSAANVAIAKARADGATPAPNAADQAQSRRAKLLALDAKNEEPLKTHLFNWKQAKARHSAIATARAQKQAVLRTHMATTASSYQGDVNKLLKRFGANFTLSKTKASFAGGGQPNTEYSINIDGFEVPAGESNNRTQPSFRTSLSSGDKSSLALALFLVQASRRADLGDLILVFDDPFSSQDSGRQFETSAAIRRLARDAKQAIVLSHDPRFLHLLLKDAGATEVSEHQITLTGRWQGKLSSWDCRKEIRGDYVRRAEHIREYAATQTHLANSNGHQLASDIRVFVEEFLDQRFPGRFAHGVTLGLMCDTIAADADDPLHAHKDDLRELNEFSRPDHHRGSTPPDPIELQAQCQKVVDILGRY